MRDFSAFLKYNAETVENTQFPASSRIKDEAGKPMLWELRCISSTEDEEVRRQATKRVTNRGQAASETDVSLYLGNLAARCTVYPDLNNKELQDSYGVMGAQQLLQAMLTPGEYAAYLRQVQTICGFDVPFAGLVEEAKN